jgi:DNA-directed RNA polymerase subunit RPC12/RpoP
MVKFACDRCGRSYSVAEELRGRAFKMKCKSCGHLIVVKPGAAPVAEAPPTILEPTPKPFLEPTPQPFLEPTPQPFSVPAIPPQPPETEKDLPFPGKELPFPETGAGIGDRLSAASAAALSSAPASVDAPVPDAPLPGAPRVPANGYVDFTLEERARPYQEAMALTPESRADEEEPILEAEPIAAPPPPPMAPIEDVVRPGLKDPFAAWSFDQDETKPPLAAEELQAEAEATDPAGPRVASAIPPPAPAQDAALARKKSGVPRPLLYGGAVALVVAGVVVLVVTRKGEQSASPPAAAEPTAGAPAEPAPPSLRVQSNTPELAAPDPQFLQASGGGGASPKTAPSQGDVPGGVRKEKRHEAEGGLQGRAVAARAEKPAVETLPQVPAPARPVEKSSLAGGRPDSSQVAQIVAANRQAFDACLSEASSRNPGLQQSGKRATLVVTVISSGDVTGSRLDDPQLAEPQLTACLRRAAKRMAFPSFEGEPLLVSVPLYFNK